MQNYEIHSKLIKGEGDKTINDLIVPHFSPSKMKYFWLKVRRALSFVKRLEFEEHNLLEHLEDVKRIVNREIANIWLSETQNELDKMKHDAERLAHMLKKFDKEFGFVIQYELSSLLYNLNHVEAKSEWIQMVYTDLLTLAKRTKKVEEQIVRSAADAQGSERIATLKSWGFDPYKNKKLARFLLSGWNTTKCLDSLSFSNRLHILSGLSKLPTNFLSPVLYSLIEAATLEKNREEDIDIGWIFWVIENQPELWDEKNWEQLVRGLRENYRSLFVINHLIRVIKELNKKDKEKRSILFTCLELTRPTSGEKLEVRTINIPYLLSEFISGNPFSSEGFTRFVEAQEHRGIIGALANGEWVTLNSDRREDPLPPLYIVVKVTSEGYLVRDSVYDAGEKGPLRYNDLTPYVYEWKKNKWHDIAFLRKKGFLVIHNTNYLPGYDYKHKDVNYENYDPVAQARINIQKAGEYWLACSSVSPKYPDLKIPRDTGVMVGNVLSAGKIMKAFSQDSGTIPSRDPKYPGDSHARMVPPPVALCRKISHHNELDVVEWESDGLFYPKQAHQNVKEKIIDAAREFKCKVFEIDYETNEWVIVHSN